MLDKSQVWGSGRGSPFLQQFHAHFTGEGTEAWIRPESQALTGLNHTGTDRQSWGLNLGLLDI